jgi:hypothetical protein
MRSQVIPPNETTILICKWHSCEQDDSFPSFCGYSRGKKAPAPEKLLKK